MSWFFIALIAPICWAITSHIEKYLISKYFQTRGVGVLVVFSALVGLIMVPVIYFIQPSVININFWFAFLIILNGFLFIISGLPTIYALRKDQASIVIPLFQLTPVFSYFLALIFLQELLSIKQILASLLIILGAVTISIEFSKRKFKHDVFWLMVLSSFLYAVNLFFFKFMALRADFWTTSFWEYAGFSIAALFFLVFVRSYRRQFFSSLKKNIVPIVSINMINEVIAIIGKICMNFATLLVPLVLAIVVNGFQPFFVLLLGISLAVFFPKFTDETLDRKRLLHKAIAIVIMFVGTYLLNM